MRQRIEAERRAAFVEVWPEHWHAVMVMRAMDTQWSVALGARGAVYLGLNYASLPTVLRATRHVKHAQPLEVLFPQLRILELQVREARNARTLH